MKKISSHFSIIFPVFVLLFSFQFANVIKSVVDDYANRVKGDYAIVVVSSSELKEEDLKKQIPEIESLTEISSKKILDRLKNDMSSKNLSLLQVALPKFYSIKLASIPDKTKVDKIKEKLAKIGSITRVETFAKTHEKIFKMLMILQTMVYIFTFFVAFVSILLVLKQIRIWIYEHSRRMAIMSLFGASFFMKSAMLYRLTIVDTLIGSLSVCAFYIFAPRIEYIQAYAAQLDIALPEFNILSDGGSLVGFSILFALIAVTIVSRKMGRV